MVDALARWLQEASGEELTAAKDTIQRFIALAGAGSSKVRQAVCQAASTLAAPAVLRVAYGSGAEGDPDCQFIQVWHTLFMFSLAGCPLWVCLLKREKACCHDCALETLAKHSGARLRFGINMYDESRLCR